MNMKKIEMVAKSYGTWYLNQKQVAAMLNCGTNQARAFLTEHGIKSHSINKKAKSYFIPEVLEAVEKTR